jgi:hypothetical protein
MKPNYNQQRAERDRAKRLKKEEKAREQDDARARRRAAEAAGGEVQPEPAPVAPVSDDPQG